MKNLVIKFLLIALYMVGPNLQAIPDCNHHETEPTSQQEDSDPEASGCHDFCCDCNCNPNVIETDLLPLKFITRLAGRFQPEYKLKNLTNSPLRLLRPPIT